MKYDKTKEDEKRETNDLQSNTIMRWLQYQENFKFNVGDVLIRQVKRWQGHNHETWETESISPTTGAPRKYVYAFENSLGIGYLRPLKVDGSGYVNTLVCMVNFDPTHTRFLLDPDYADHLLLGGDAEQFTHNEEYAQKRKFREEAMAKNRAMLINTKNTEKTTEWFNTLQIGTVFWMADTIDGLNDGKFEVEEIVVMVPHGAVAQGVSSTVKPNYNLIKLKNNVGRTNIYTVENFYRMRISMQQPYPLKDELS